LPVHVLTDFRSNQRADAGTGTGRKQLTGAASNLRAKDASTEAADEAADGLLVEAAALAAGSQRHDSNNGDD
jgi:hypothetical protein